MEPYYRSLIDPFKEPFKRTPKIGPYTKPYPLTPAAPIHSHPKFTASVVLDPETPIALN